MFVHVQRFQRGDEHRRADDIYAAQQPKMPLCCARSRV